MAIFAERLVRKMSDLIWLNFVDSFLRKHGREPADCMAGLLKSENYVQARKAFAREAGNGDLPLTRTYLESALLEAEGKISGKDGK